MTIKIATLMAVYSGDSPMALSKSIDSILNQEFNEEIVSRIYLAIDGPVSDEILQVIEERKKKLYVVHKLERNGGLAVALNALIEILGSEAFVFRMDADDFSDVRRFQTQLEYFQKKPSVDILGTDIIESDEFNSTRRIVSFCRGNSEAVKNLCWRVPVAHPTVCFRRHVLTRIGGYPIKHGNEDIALWFKCAQEGFEFDNVRIPLLTFRISQDFWHRRSFNKSISEWKCYNAGIWEMHGITWKYVYPMLRLALRISPSWLSHLAYNSSFRRKRS